MLEEAEEHVDFAPDVQDGNKEIKLCNVADVSVL